MVSPDLDHIAFAVNDLEGCRTVMEQHFGGQQVGGGTGPGFRSEQWRLANGMRVELLEPHAPDSSPFLRRFLESAGPGAHHLTFRVPDIHEAVERVCAEGFDVLYLRADEPRWQEAFLHPRVAFGTVIQLAAYPDEPVDDSPDPARPRVSLERIVLGVDDPDRARRLFCDALGGTRDGDDVVWPRRARLRLVQHEGSGIKEVQVSGLPDQDDVLHPFGSTPVRGWTDELV